MMRDDHLMQEKLELSLERRHVALVAACALVLLGGVFSLGVLVGRQLAWAALSGPHAPAAGDLPALDAEKDAPAPKPPPPAAVPARSAAAQSDGPATHEAAQDRDPRPSRASPDAAVRLPPPPAAASVASAPARPASAQAPPVSADEVDDDADSEDASAREPAAAAGEVVVIPQAKVATVNAPKAAPRVAASGPLPPPPKDLGQFTVQLGASQDRTEAHRLEARARAAGLRPYVIEANLGRKGVWYRVRVGAFAAKESAERYHKDVDRELRISSVVMPSR